MNTKVAGLLGFFAQVMAVLLFSWGFFEFRSGGPQGESNEECRLPIEPTYDRLVFMVIDALRSDFVYGAESNFAFLNGLLKTEPHHAKSFIARARPPTVTMPRLKALTAGSPPIFLDLIMNFDERDTATSSTTCGSSGFTQDTWVKAFKDAGKKVIFYGDDTWTRMFPGCFDREHGVYSFFVWDYTEVDTQVTERAIPALEESDWDVMILHYLGLDHIGHVDGARSRLMSPKQAEMDGMVKRLYGRLQEKDLEDGKSSLIIVLGDHGMADNGNHGGSSDLELNTAAIVLSPSKRFTGDAQQKLINQVDLVPTIAGLFGLRVPESSTGAVVEDLLPEEQQTLIIRQNVCQLQKHLSQTEVLCSEEDTACWKEHLRRMAIEVDSLTGDYSLEWMLVAIVLLVAVLAFTVRNSPSGGWRELAFALAYIVLQSSSSFIEEEHEFWFFAFSFLILYRFVFVRTDYWKAAQVLCLARVPRYWNSLGAARADDVDARSWLPPQSPYTAAILVAVLSLGWLKYTRQTKRPFLGVLYAAASLLVLAFKYCPREKEVALARICYASVGILLIGHVRAVKQPLQSVRWILALLFLFLLKIHNAAIVGVLALVGEHLCRFEDCLLDDSIILSFIHYSYFALGPSNLLVSLDFSNAYIGLTQFNMILISSITFLITWAGPLMAGLLFLERPYRRTRCLVYDLSLWRCFVTVGLLSVLTLHRYHIQIWTTFAPRLLFEFGWSVFYALLLLGISFV